MAGGGHYYKIIILLLAGYTQGSELLYIKTWLDGRKISTSS